MKSRLALPLIFVACAFVLAGFDVRPTHAQDAAPAGREMTFEETGGRACGTPEPTAAEMAAVQRAVDYYLRQNGTMAVGGQIKVAFHVIYYGSEGNIPQSQIDAQIAQLNSCYSGTGYSFVLASVDRTSNRQWFTMTPGTRAETQCKNTLAISPATRLNLYTCKPGQSLLGWSYFPNSYPESDKRHGVVVHYGSVPGGYLTAYNEGDTAVHEVGHYLGLYHTFQGGCTAPGDYVDDTPYEASAYTGGNCSLQRDTCTQPGLDPITNYMDYSYDPCLTNFTAGQDVRMDSIVPVYRPSLLGAARTGTGTTADLAPVTDANAVAFAGAFPNPVQEATILHFALPRAGQASLRLYNVAGRLVGTLAQGDYEAGNNSVQFARGGLAAGTYFAVLEAAGQRLTRPVILQ
jgi:hypothetical protein